MTTPAPYAQGFDEHVSYMVQSVFAANGEYPTQSHFAWLHRMYSRVLLRSLELDRREAELAQREAALTNRAFPPNQKKPRRNKNGGDRPDKDHPAADESSA